MYLRKQSFKDIGQESAFLWGARQTGKSTLLKALFPEAPFYFDLLYNDVFERFQRNPSLIREILLMEAPGQTVIIDEIQRLPSLLFEIQWLIVNKNLKFILSGSSPKKILRSGGNLLGGRALRYNLYPLVFPEIPDFDLIRALNQGLLPRHYLATNPEKLISAYIGSYLKDEIEAEAKIRNIATFSKFLEAAAFSNGEMVNYSNIATDCGVSAPTIRDYFQILQDTMTGIFLSSFQKKPKRRVILAPKFYFFDVGIVNYFLKRRKIEAGSELFGNAFEHFIFLELNAHSHYSSQNYPVTYWRTTSGFEVDFILGDHEVAIETKGTSNVNPRHLKGLKSFAEEYPVKRLILVSNDPFPRRMDSVDLLPWKIFLEKLWGGELIK